MTSEPSAPAARDALDIGLRNAGVSFRAEGGRVEEAFSLAIRELARCIIPMYGAPALLIEGGVYHGCWLESTASISTEVLARFVPEVARATHELYAEHTAPDGLLPFRITEDGPDYWHLQIVSPLARSVWRMYKLGVGDKTHLRTMYNAMVANDEWIAAHRDSRGTGAVEAFCTFDTGHDLSPRFWNLPHSTPDRDPRQWNREIGMLPLIAPDMTANIACQREYLARIAEELGDDPVAWERKRDASVSALFEQCFDEDDRFFYDRDALGNLVRIQSDVMLRVLACEIGGDDFFDSALRDYILCSRKFLARYGFTSLAMDDPRFDHDMFSSSWGGPTNFLTMLRAPDAFESHGRHAELAAISLPMISAAERFTTFPQTVSSWSGQATYTEAYSPAILWYLDTIERLFGIMPRPTGETWFTGMLPWNMDDGETTTSTTYTRTIGNRQVELTNQRAVSTVTVDGAEHLRFPHGVRVVTSEGSLEPVAIIGMLAQRVHGELVIAGRSVTVDVGPNERLVFTDGTLTSEHAGSFIPVSY